MVSIVHAFDLELAMPPADVNYDHGLTLPMRNGLHVRVNERRATVLPR